MNLSQTRAHIPFLTAEQMVEVDRLMVEQYGIDLVQMMENAGRNLAHLARVRFLDGSPSGSAVVVLAGTGGNGGGALGCARRLHNWGADVRVAIAKPDEAFTPVPARQAETLRRMAVPIGAVAALAEDDAPDLIVDGVIGYSLRDAPTGSAADAIRWAASTSAPILSLDVPSGVDATTGTVFDPAVRATATLTLALPKEGLRTPQARGHVGELYLGDLSVPPALYAEPTIGISVPPLFARDDIVRVW